MDWLEDTDPFVLKDSITRKRIAQGLVPQRRKWQDTQHVRNQVCWRWWFKIDGHPRGLYTHGITGGGIPWYKRQGELPHYDAHGRQRNRQRRPLRRFNGSQEWGSSWDAWGKPHVQGKSSRHRMRLIDEWWNEAATEMDVLNTEGV